MAGSAITGCAARLPSESGTIPAFNVTARPGTRVLVYTAGWVTVSNGESSYRFSLADTIAIEAITKIGQRHGFRVDTTTSRSAFTDERLARYTAVLFLKRGAVGLLSDHEAALQRFIRRGGGFVGIWSVDGTEHRRPWYRRLVGTEIPPEDVGKGPRQENAEYVIHTGDSSHLSMRGVPEPWVINEYYSVYSSLDPGVEVLATVDPRSFSKYSLSRGLRKITVPMPVSWYHEFEGGRAWLTMLGTARESYSDPAFLNHLAGGILWAAGAGQREGVPRQ